MYVECRSLSLIPSSSSASCSCWSAFSTSFYSLAGCTSKD
uniref:Uncharacterized protein n=1 Tax=Anopheles minimus TaxID=112268 RepID=A0A182WMS4_9DIPT